MSLMSPSEASPTKGISGWWKQLKKKEVNTSNESFEVNGGSYNLARPSLNFKSRSYNSVRRVSNDNIRQQRDEFIALQKKTGFSSNGIFGVNLGDSIKVAESLISVPCDDPNQFIRYGKIPLLIGKCGSFLKQKGLDTEGIFRIAGASRRVKELQYIFSSPPDYGRKLTWEGYTAHDAASLFRRFLNNLPEPLVPLELYEQFREPIKSRPRIVNHIQTRNDSIDKKIRQIQEKRLKEARGEIVSPDDEGEPEKTEEQKMKDAKKTKKISKDIRKALKEYRVLFEKLPEAQRHLLFYLLDMLTIFSDCSKENLMPARNLAAIFQPSILSHPDHDLTPDEYALSQAVVEVLIEYSSKLLPNLSKQKKGHGKSTTTATTSATTTTTTTTVTGTLSKPDGVETAAALLKESGSNKNSSTNLLAVRNSSKGSRPHSRSLSSTTDLPEVNITKKIDQPIKEQLATDDDETTDEEIVHDESQHQKHCQQHQQHQQQQQHQQHQQQQDREKSPKQNRDQAQSTKHSHQDQSYQGHKPQQCPQQCSQQCPQQPQQPQQSESPLSPQPLRSIVPLSSSLTLPSSLPLPSSRPPQSPPPPHPQAQAQVQNPKPIKSPPIIRVAQSVGGSSASLNSTGGYIQAPTLSNTPISPAPVIPKSTTTTTSPNMNRKLATIDTTCPLPPKITTRRASESEGSSSAKSRYNDGQLSSSLPYSDTKPRLSNTMKVRTTTSTTITPSISINSSVKNDLTEEE